MEEAIDLLKAVFKSAAEGIIIADESGTIRQVNPKSEEMFGYSEGEMVGMKIEELVPLPIKKSHVALREKYHTDPTPRPMGTGRDLEGLKKNREVFPLEIGLSHFIRDQKKYVAAFITDITERKQNEEKLADYTSSLEKKVRERTQELEHLNLGLLRENKERKSMELKLRESQQLYELIAQNFPKGIISILDSNFQFLFAAGKGLHKDNEPNIGDHFLLRFPVEIREKIETHLKNTLKGITGSREYESNDKNYILQSVPIENNAGKIDKLLVVEEDITELKHVELEVRANLAREKELNVMKSRFVSMASHEFRTPLTTVLSSINLISKYTKEEDQPRRDKHISRIKTSVKNLTEILNDFLSLERLESGSLDPQIVEVSIPDIIEESVEQMNGLLKADQEVIVNKKLVKNQIDTDPRLLKNIIINLLSNAIKYSPDGKEVFFDFKLDEKEMYIEIRDQGIGIPESEQKNLFQRFFRAGNAVNIQGTGLGLHIVKKYVELLGGNISLESKEQIGTTIKVLIPHE